MTTYQHILIILKNFKIIFIWALSGPGTAVNQSTVEGSYTPPSSPVLPSPQYSPVLHYTAQYCRAQCYTAQYYTAQYCTPQYCTPQYSPVPTSQVIRLYYIHFTRENCTMYTVHWILHTGY